MEVLFNRKYMNKTIVFLKSGTKIQQKLHIRKFSGVFFANRIKFYVLRTAIRRLCSHRIRYIDGL